MATAFITAFIIIWCIIGLIGWLFTYHSWRKRWYIEHSIELWKSENKILLIFLIITIPLFLFGGICTLWYWMLVTDKKYWSLWFRIKNN